MNDEARAHLKRARENLEDAKVLLSGGRRSAAVSRCYYAMFEAASAMLADGGLRFSRHGEVISQFGEKFAKTDKVDRRFGRDLSRAYDLRWDADYAIDSRSEISADVAEAQFRKAREFVAVAEQFLKGVGGGV